MVWRPAQGCHGQRNLRSSVPWAFSRRVVQHREASFLRSATRPRQPMPRSSPEPAPPRVGEIEIAAHGASTSEPLLLSPIHVTALAADLKAWAAATTNAGLKKRIVRTVIREVVADINNEPSEIVLLIHWGLAAFILSCASRSGAVDSATARPAISSWPSANWCSSPMMI
ncbi:hypothetical protein BQ8794_180006 [Mesorhizobium prunaredense]|uniref:Uncharacterized protein n=1 Tax=Mesorhizobium prunaredense TaxID=1631249 RepID=A0A1R3V419_9HYPH|nr:hypothetical protein BQ8794_180006 [Mesorhizobium prunaredense]